MKRIVGALVIGQSLRHRPVSLHPDEQRPVRAGLRTGRGSRDVTPSLFPVSLDPLLLGLWSAEGDAPDPAIGTAAGLRLHDAASGTEVGSLRLRAERVLAGPGGGVLLLRPTRSAARCVPAADRAWRYLLAWRQARRNAKVPNAFQMTFADLRALNVFYMMPRPVFLVSVVHGDASNIFPMDLVGPVGDDTFLLALRRTSPAIELMRASGRIVVSSIPAAFKAHAYQLGVHHKAKSIDWSRLPFAVEPSPVFGTPVPAEAFRVRELEVRQSVEVGSHVFFFTRVAGDLRRADAPQLCHVSEMYARWRAAQNRPFVDL
jgi:flavin reductase (DIM6/NTAB) family NADH-FMN oxidoreductase RutF